MSYNVLREDGTLKICSGCGKTKPIEEFYSNKARSTGRYSQCILCFKPTLEYPKVNDFRVLFTEYEIQAESWRDVFIGEEKMPYQISNLGRLKSNFRGESLYKYSYDQRGYPQVVLYGFRRVSRRVHRLVAMAWVPNPENKREVNHKDGNKLNTLASNMEWNTSKENTKHAFDTNLRKN